MSPDDIIEDLIRHFPRSKTDILEWADSYRRVFDGKSADVLGAAYRKTIDQWSRPGFPRPSDIVESIAGEVSSLVSRDLRQREIDDRAKAAAEAMMRTGLGRRALAEGWHLILYERFSVTMFKAPDTKDRVRGIRVAQYAPGYMPNGADIASMRRAKEKLDETGRDVMQEGGHLAGMYLAIVERGGKLAKRLEA